MLVLSKGIAVTKKDNMKYIRIQINLYLQDYARAEIGDYVCGISTFISYVFIFLLHLYLQVFARAELGDWAL